MVICYYRTGDLLTELSWHYQPFSDLIKTTAPTIPTNNRSTRLVSSVGSGTINCRKKLSKYVALAASAQALREGLFFTINHQASAQTNAAISENVGAERQTLYNESERS